MECLMELKQSEMLRIFVAEQTRYGHHPLYEEIVREARIMELAGATVLKGVLSYGHDASKVMEMGSNLPIVIELVDSVEKIEEFMPILQQLVRDSSSRAMITRESVRTGVIE